MEAKEKEGKYVHLIGAARIQIIDGKLNIFLLDDSRKDINRDNPIILEEHALFVNMHLVAEFGEEQFKAHQSLFANAKQAFVEFGLLTKPEEESILSVGSKFVDCMTSTDPPCENMVVA